ncbi:preQ(1) synthase [Desulfonatronovibrio hydrogenovorans]|uniref:preQ(1) synthase n=1 Tax=Desulfonatronovibrio hydrogenovorans TaxID=53245 RepID=UPI000492196C|nr:preQ(1) synthase [Desulfonatronovibrio hydrogenovorans]
MHDDTSSLTLLGRTKADYPSRVDSDILETFPNRFPQRDYQVVMATDEFTSLCPVTGQPDYGTIEVRYVPDQQCIESKSLKIYLFSYRQEPTFMETVVNRILDDLVARCSPRQMKVTGRFKARGGIAIDVAAEYSREG